MKSRQVFPMCFRDVNRNKLLQWGLTKHCASSGSLLICNIGQRYRRASSDNSNNHQHDAGVRVRTHQSASRVLCTSSSGVPSLLKPASSDFGQPNASIGVPVDTWGVSRLPIGWRAMRCGELMPINCVRSRHSRFAGNHRSRGVILATPSRNGMPFEPHQSWMDCITNIR